MSAPRRLHFAVLRPVAFYAALLALGLTACATAGKPARAHLSMFLSPLVGMAPATVHAVVRVAGEGNRDRWACERYAWSWGDGDFSAHDPGADCLEPAYSWTASHRYTVPGIYPIGFACAGTVIVGSVEFR